MTEKLYENDSYLQTFTATVLACTPAPGGYAVVLDRTAFYPEGGGQPCDTGRLGDAAVRAVHTDGETITHTTDAPLPVGGTVEGSIDWPARLDAMQQHTGRAYPERRAAPPVRRGERGVPHRLPLGADGHQHPADRRPAGRSRGRGQRSRAGRHAGALLPARPRGTGPHRIPQQKGAGRPCAAGGGGRRPLRLLRHPSGPHRGGGADQDPLLPALQGRHAAGRSLRPAGLRSHCRGLGRRRSRRTAAFGAGGASWTGAAGTAAAARESQTQTAAGRPAGRPERPRCADAAAPTGQAFCTPAWAEGADGDGLRRIAMPQWRAVHGAPPAACPGPPAGRGLAYALAAAAPGGDVRPAWAGPSTKPSPAAAAASRPSARAAWRTADPARVRAFLAELSLTRSGVYLNAMRMRFKPYARPELLACDFHVHEPLTHSRPLARALRPARPALAPGTGPAARAGSWPRSPRPTPTSTTWASDITDKVLILAKRKVEAAYAAPPAAPRQREDSPAWTSSGWATPSPPRTGVGAHLHQFLQARGARTPGATSTG